MTGSVAATIQGEAGGNPANQFAVASTIYNRMQRGGFPGGASASGIVNAPNQYVAQASPNATAQQFAQAIEDGTLPKYGNVGNAVNFQTAGSSTTLGRDPAAVNIGGNNFSDRFGTPTANFIPPEYGGINAVASSENGITNENIGTVDFTTGTAFETSLGTDGTISDNTATASGDILSDPNTGQSVGPMFGQADSTGGTAFHPTSGIPTEGIVKGVTVAKNAILAGVPDVSNALNRVSVAIDAASSTTATYAREKIAALEAYAGRGLVMVLAMVLILAAAWLLVPRGTKEAVIATAAKAAA